MSTLVLGCWNTGMVLKAIYYMVFTRLSEHSVKLKKPV